MFAALLVLGQASKLPSGEDLVVMEMALTHFFNLGKSTKNTLVALDKAAYGRPVVVANTKEKMATVAADLRRDLASRNARPPSFADWKPVNPHLTVKPESKLARREYYASVFLPGYSTNRSRAVVSFGFTWSIHWAQGCVLLEKRDERWKILWSDADYYL